MPPLAQAPDQAVAVEYGMDGAGGRDADVTGEPAHQDFADLAGAPGGFSRLQATISIVTWAGSWLAYRTGRRERSARATGPFPGSAQTA